MLKTEDKNIKEIDFPSLLRHQTPLYIYIEKRIRENIMILKREFSKVKPQIFYAIKANTSLTILRIVREEGLYAETVSPGEIFIALKAGFKGGEIINDSVARKKEDVLYALNKGVKFFNFESLDQAILLQSVAREKGFTILSFIRVNPCLFLKNHPYLSTGSSSSKFGIEFNEVVDVVKELKNKKGIRITGIHSHIGSQILNSRPFIKNAERMAELLELFKRMGIKIRFVNLGGGFGIPYKQKDKPLDFAPIVESYYRLKKDFDVNIFLEPGRFIVGNAGIILSRVVSVKKRNNKPLYIIDAGMTENPRPAIYQAFHNVISLKESKDRILSRVSGPLCENADEFGTFKLPPLGLGDPVIILNSGAYTRTMAMNYNGRIYPAEFISRNNNIEIIRKPQKFEDLIRNEKND